MFHGRFHCFENQLLEVGLTQNWETVALRNLTIVDLLYIVIGMGEDARIYPHKLEGKTHHKHICT